MHKRRLFAAALLLAFAPLLAYASTLSDLQSELAALEAQLTSLQTSPSIPAGTMATPTDIAPGASQDLPACPVLTRILSKGMSGSDVFSLQQFFSYEYANYTSDDITGYFGNITQDAVQQWQEEHGVVSGGSPGTTGYGVVGPKTRAAIAQVCEAALSANTAQNGNESSYPSASSSTPCLWNGQSVTSGTSVVAYQTSSVAAGTSCQAEIRQCTNGALSGTYNYGSCSAVSTSQSPPPTPASCSWNGQSISSGSSIIAYQSSSVVAGASCQAQTRICTNGTLSGNDNYASCSVQQAPASCSWNGQTVASGSSVVAYQSATAPAGTSCQAQVRQCSNGELSGSYTAASCSTATSTSSQCTSASSIGFVSDGTTPNDAQFNAWATSLPSSGGCLEFDAGKYAFNSPLTVDLPSASTASITIKGAGADVTTLYFPNSAGLTINESSQQHSFHLEDFSITTGTTGAGSAITLNNSSNWYGTFVAQSDITGVTIRGDDGDGEVDYWATGIADTYVSNIDFDNDDLYFDSHYHGTGVSLSAPSSQSCYAGGPCVVGINFNNVSFNFPNIGLIYGNDVENVAMTNSAFWNGTTGIYVPSGSIGLQSLNINNATFGTHCNGISTDSALPYVQVYNSTFQVSTSCSGILLGYYQGATITGNTFYPYSNPGSTPNYGVAFGTLAATGYPSTVDSNTFTGFGVAINLGQGSSEVTVGSSNNFSGNGQNIRDQGTGNTVEQ